MSLDSLTERERHVLEAVIRTFVDSAEPAGSRTVARRFPLGVSAATVRNTMADLEEKGYLFHPHTSAGRVPTDRAYRYYVDRLMRPVPLTPLQEQHLSRELADAEAGTAIERVLRQAAQALGLLTGELGVAVAPRLDEAKLEKLELVSVSSDKVLLILTLDGGLVRTVYVDLPMSVPPETLRSVTHILNERLAGQTLLQIRRTLPDRLRDTAARDDATSSVLNVFLQSADELFEGTAGTADQVHLGRTSVLAGQPEFASGSQLKNLIELTEQRDLLASVLSGREHEATLKVTIGAEHPHPELNDFTLVTSEYRGESISGVIGVIGPTRMPYEKVVAIVDHTSALLSTLSGPLADRPTPGSSRKEHA